MTSGSPIRAMDVHSHWSTKRGYPLQTEAELSRLQHTWRAELIYRSEAEMAEDFRQARQSEREPSGYWGREAPRLYALAQQWHQLPHRSEALLTLNGLIARTMLGH
jgi:hypothetical protein